MTDETRSDSLTDADWEALARYLAGESTPEESAAVERRLAADPGSAELVAILGRAMGAPVPATALDVEGALARVHGRMRDEAEERTDATVVPFRRSTTAAGRRFWHSTPVHVAAAALLVAGGLFAWRMRSGDPAHDVLVVRQFATSVGRRDSVRLPDGTRVLLGPGSQLAVDAGFARGQREVRLTGEALFDVVHDAAHPFTVHAGRTVIQDVGTVFSVHSDSADGVRLVVSSGAVRLSVLPAAGTSGRDASGVELRAGDLASVDTASHVALRRAGATPEDLAWTSGMLVFREAPMAQVAADLRRWYGIELRVGDPELAGRHLTATFRGDSSSGVLQQIAMALNAGMELHGDTVVLVRRR